MEDLRARLLNKKNDLLSKMEMCKGVVLDQTIPIEKKKYHGALWHCAQIEYLILEKFLNESVNCASDLYEVNGTDVKFIYEDMMDNKEAILEKINSKQNNEL